METKNKYAVGVDLGGTTIKVGLVTADGKIVVKKELESFAEINPDAVIKQIIKGINLVSEGYENKIVGVGIGSPGMVITKKGTVEYPPNFNEWGSVPLAKIIKKKIKKEVHVENDANAAAIGEFIFGAGRNLDSFIMITLGTGVGGGIILNKKLYHGDNGAAGEIGHVSINGSGPKCKCGSYGCIEAYVGKDYLIKRAKRNLANAKNSKLYKLVNVKGEELTPKLISSTAKSGDKFSISVIQDVGNKLGVVLSSVINLLDVSNVVIGGGIAGFGKLLIKSTSEATNARVMKSLRGKVKVHTAKLKNEAGIQGASALVFYKS
ncbi:ROK family protein [Bacteroidota bacterium]